jgi:hypothetical protein
MSSAGPVWVWRDQTLLQAAGQAQLLGRRGRDDDHREDASGAHLCVPAHVRSGPEVRLVFLLLNQCAGRWLALPATASEEQITGSNIAHVTSVQGLVNGQGVDRC